MLSTSPSSLLWMQVNLQALEVVLLDNSCSSESIPSLRVSLHEMYASWQTHSRTPIHMDGSFSQNACLHESAQFQAVLRCKFFNSRLDVEDFFISVRFCHSYLPAAVSRLQSPFKISLDVSSRDETQDWPITFKHDALPALNVRNASISSSGDLVLRLSPACLDTIVDCTTFVDQLLANEKHKGDGHSTAATYANQRSTTVRRDPRLTADRGRGQCSLFKVVNYSGLGAVCYPNTEEKNTPARMELAPTGQVVSLKFRPCQEMVHLPDSARTVCHF